MTTIQLRENQLIDALNTLVEIQSLLQQVSSEKEHEIYRDAAIQRFEYTIELAWKVLKDRLYESGIVTQYPMQVLREAFIAGMIDDEDVWVRLLQNRNLASHTYSSEISNVVVQNIPDAIRVIQKIIHS